MFDIVGVAIFVTLIVVFGFLTLRVWKAKSRWLKWVGAPLSGLLTLVSAALLILALTGFYKLNQHFDNPITEVSITPSPQQIARGAQLANICVSCHTPGIWLPGVWQLTQILASCAPRAICCGDGVMVTSVIGLSKCWFSL